MLSHYKSPASKQQLGWQSWDIVRAQKEQAVLGGNEDNGTIGDDDWDPWDDLGYSLPLDNWVSSSALFSSDVAESIGPTGTSYDRM